MSKFSNLIVNGDSLLELKKIPEKTFDSMEENHQIEIVNAVLEVKKN